jgi:hypothetical protein
MRVIHGLIRTRSASDGSIRAWSPPQADDTINPSRPPQADQGADRLHGVLPVLLLCAVLFATVAGCHKSTPTPPPEEQPATAEAPKSPPTEAPPPPIPLPDDPDAADRWLFVEKAKDGSPGGWATGAFDRQKNKLDIHTRDVRQFAIDVERIAIDWQRLVVLSIDGKNSELRKRDVSLLHFRLDDHGQWVVMEP